MPLNTHSVLTVWPSTWSRAANTKVRPWRAMIINCVLRCGLVWALGLSKQMNWPGLWRDVWGHLKTSGDSRFSSLSAITEWSLDPDPLQARAKHTAAPWACTLQHCRLCRHAKAWAQPRDVGTRMRLRPGSSEEQVTIAWWVTSGSGRGSLSPLRPGSSHSGN